MPVNPMQFPYKEETENPGRMTSRRVQPGSIIHTRVVPPVAMPDIESEPAKSNMLGLMHLASKLEDLARIIDDHSRPVDEYLPQNTAVSTLSVEVQPTFDVMPEMIKSVIVTGPAGTVTLQLGDRIWSLTIPASGILVIAPVGILLSNADRRVLTGAVAGNYGLELTGWANERFVP